MTARVPGLASGVSQGCGLRASRAAFREIIAGVAAAGAHAGHAADSALAA